MVEQAEPTLAAPGAGLPNAELFAVRLALALRQRTGSRRAFEHRFLAERTLISDFVSSCNAESGATRILIRRPAGLEDSSRYWSVWMTLDHLRIVHVEIAKIIAALANGCIPAGRASTADVKPRTEATSAVVAAYEASCDALLATVATSPSLKTTVRFSHPWFGSLDAAGWFALTSMHMGIHRLQIRRIIKGLSVAKK